MKNSICCVTALAFLVAAVVVCADDIKLSDGTVFHNANIASSDSATVTIRYSTGIAHVLISDLPEELPIKYRHDPLPPKPLLIPQQAAATTRLQTPMNVAKPKKVEQAGSKSASSYRETGKRRFAAPGLRRRGC